MQTKKGDKKRNLELYIKLSAKIYSPYCPRDGTCALVSVLSVREKNLKRVARGRTKVERSEGGEGFQ